ncbi:hypothetical protein CKO44_03800 [Rubrivivax gelatinosus]|uniref:alpha/beta hydrolase fold domain-containing protein n=1 Tax=Rubrivivax gelatinosus TaxID=28068 RepID=UPI0019085174|nr:alpha/beta hydrolase fold domain-containing protein [Rubrivivax gelatinosus]MBK1612587.1 hypothetical protein [Rubrivivax gelatinosus]
MNTIAPTRTAAWRDHQVDAGLGESLAVRVHAAVADGAELPARCPLVLHLPGGAFIGGDLDSGLPTARLLAESGSVVVSLDYPKAPARPFPAALQAAAALLRWLLRMRCRLAGTGSAIWVAGEEAGANLAAGLALWARDQRLPLAGQLLISPLLDPRMASASLRAAGQGCADCTIARGWHAFLGREGEHPYAAPLYAARLAHVAPAFVAVAEDDPLRDEGLAYAAALRAAGVAVQTQRLAGPTGWPQALTRLASLQSPWAAELRCSLRAFLAEGLACCPIVRRPSRRAGPAEPEAGASAA